MDSTRRHKLAENSLAKWFNTQYEEWIAPNSGLLSTLVLLVLVALCCVMLYTRYMEWNRSAAWKKYYTALGAENPNDELQRIAETGKDPVLSQARLTLAQMALSEACQVATTDKEKATQQLEKAMDLFSRLQTDASAVVYRQQAAFGHAQALETLASLRSGNDLAEAEKEYRKIADQWPESFYGKRAAKQVALISRPLSKMFMERSIAKAAEQPKPEDFKVEIDTKDPFVDGPGSFDAQKALGDDKPAAKPEEPKEEPKTKEKPETKTDEAKE